jgi:hypothetical protein
MKVQFYKFLISVLLATAVFACGSHSANAISNVFSDATTSTGNGGTPTDLYPMVSVAGGGVTLNAPSATFRVFIPVTKTSGNVTITILKACDSTGINDIGGSPPPIKVSVGGQTKQNYAPGNDCGSGPNLTFQVNENKFGTLVEYGDNFKTIQVTVTKIGIGIKNFKVSADAGSGCGGPCQEFVTFDNLSINDATHSTGKPGDAFSIWNADQSSSNYESDFTFTFKPSCLYNPNDSVWLKWFDADYNSATGNETGDISWNFRDITDTGPDSTNLTYKNADLGGEGAYKQVDVASLNRTHTYRWTWHNVNRKNGVQIWMPFNEFNQLVNCDNKPDGQLVAHCWGIDGWITDENAPAAGVQYRLKVNGAVVHSGTADEDIYRVNHGYRFFMASLSGIFGNGGTAVTFDLDVKDISSTGAVSATWTNIVHGPLKKQCTGPDTPPTATITGDCNAVHIRGIDDAQENGNGVHVVVKAFHGDYADTNGDGFPDNYQTLYDGRTTGDLDFPPPPEDNVNNGWRYGISLDNVKTNGTDSTGLEAFTMGKYFDTAPTGRCYTASCTVDIQPNFTGAPANGVKAGQTFWVTVKITNDSPVAVLRSAVPTVYPWVPSASLSASVPAGTWGAATAGHALGTSLSPGQSSSVTFQLTAPADAGSYALQVYPDYYGLMGIGDYCSSGGDDTVDVYQPFQFTPVLGNITAYDTENPEKITYGVKVDQVFGQTPDGSKYWEDAVPGIEVNSRLWYEKNLAGAYSYVAPDLHTSAYAGSLGGSTIISSRSPTAPIARLAANTTNPKYSKTETWEDTVYPASRQFRAADSWGAGDHYCASIKVVNYSGWISGTSVISDGNLSLAPTCPNVQNRPYLRTYGADVSAGGGFGTGCGTNAGIEAFTRPNAELGTKGGSGSQLAAFGSTEINGFSSAFLRTGAPLLPTGLTFASNQNTAGTVGSDENRPHDGGNFGAPTAACAANFYGPENMLSEGDARRSPVSGSAIATSYDVAALPDDHQTISKPGGTGTLTLTSSGAFTRRHAIFVDGNVFIKDNIIYSASTNPAWADLNSIANFSLVVQGNIYISQDVSRLDGLYVAQPKSGVANSGKIYTCTNRADGSLFADPNTLWDQCQKQLTVYGSFVANDVRFLRSIYTLSDSKAAEPSDCSIIGKPAGCPEASKASEIFQTSPEMYLSQPVFRPLKTVVSGQYNYITTLPPIL